MKIKNIRIQNFRSFQDETINLNSYSCFVGPNGVGKSNVLAALNVFFREQSSSATDVIRLSEEDYFMKNTSVPIRVTVTFHNIGPVATQELSAYVRDGELVVSVEAIFDEGSAAGLTRYFGQRKGMDAFRAYFEADKAGAKAGDLQGIYDQLRVTYTELPVAKTKDAKVAALQAYEAVHVDQTVLIPSEDNFYGINSTGKLGPFVQWVYVPAVKDAKDEEQESKSSALGKLIARAVRTRTNFDDQLEALRTVTLASYQALLEQNRASLVDVAQALKVRLESWAHPNVRLDMDWLSDPKKSVTLQPPVAGIKTGDGDFLGSLSRMGHGLQRSYLLALLQELANSEAPNAPTLILGCEEPELYQHPPQARYLAEVFSELALGNNQVLVTTHSPLFVNGEGFENVRLVQRNSAGASSRVRALRFEDLCQRIRAALVESQGPRIQGRIAKIHQALQPGIAEMFFARIPILVEGQEDVSYITTELHVSNQWSEFRRLGCHLIPVNGKDKLIQPLAIARELGISIFVIFDADGDSIREEHRIKHERDNRAIFSLLNVMAAPFPENRIIGRDFSVWPTNITGVVKNDFGVNYDRIVEGVRVNYAHEGGLEKNDLFIAEWLTAAADQGLRSPILSELCVALLTFARTTTT